MNFDVKQGNYPLRVGAVDLPDKASAEDIRAAEGEATGVLVLSSNPHDYAEHRMLLLLPGKGGRIEAIFNKGGGLRSSRFVEDGGEHRHFETDDQLAERKQADAERNPPAEGKPAKGERRPQA